MINIKLTNELKDTDISSYIYYCEKYDKSEFLIESESYFNSMISFINKYLPKNIKNIDYNELIYPLMKNLEKINKDYNLWVKKELNNKSLLNNFIFSNMDDFKNFIENLIHLAFYFRIYKFTSNLRELNDNTINKYLNVINYYDEVINNPKLYITDNDCNKSLDLTIKEYPFLEKKCFKNNSKDIKFLKRTILELYTSYIKNNDLPITLATAISINDYYYMYRSTNEMLGIAFNELLTIMISDRSYTKIIECARCKKTFIRKGNQVYCSKKCGEEARIDSHKRYNKSEKGKKRAKTFYIIKKEKERKEKEKNKKTSKK